MSSSEEKAAPEIERRAYLVFANQIFRLNQNVTNLGRRLTNHLVIEDQRVSRNHAQIRKVNNQFYIVDLNSTGGTLVNDHQISQTMLFSGDEISLAGYKMVFMLDTGKLIDSTEQYTTPIKIGNKKTAPHNRTGMLNNKEPK